MTKTSAPRMQSVRSKIAGERNRLLGSVRWSAKGYENLIYRIRREISCAKPNSKELELTHFTVLEIARTLETAEIALLAIVEKFYKDHYNIPASPALTLKENGNESK